MRQDLDTGQYSLGAKVVWLASKFLESVEIRRIARPILEKLSLTTSETIHLGLLDGFEILYIDKVDGRGAIRMASPSTTARTKMASGVSLRQSAIMPGDLLSR